VCYVPTDCMMRILIKLINYIWTLWTTITNHNKIQLQLLLYTPNTKFYQTPFSSFENEKHEFTQPPHYAPFHEICSENSWRYLHTRQENASPRPWKIVITLYLVISQKNSMVEKLPIVRHYLKIVPTACNTCDAIHWHTTEQSAQMGTDIMAFLGQYAMHR